MKTVVLDIEIILNALAAARAAVDTSVGFPPWPLHELVCASVFSVRSELGGGFAFGIESFTRESLSERAIVASVERAIENAGEVVIYNGGGFDLPVLLARAARPASERRRWRSSIRRRRMSSAGTRSCKAIERHLRCAQL